jgi:hypothetical protein
MEVNEIDQTILNFKNNLNFVRKMKHFLLKELLVIIVIINFYIIYESWLILLLFYKTGSKGIGAKKYMQSIPLPL